MFSLACVLDSVGYDRLEREPFSEEETKDDLRSSSGMLEDLCETSSLESLRVLRDDLLLRLRRSLSFSRSRSLSFDFGLLRSRSGSLLRLRDDSDGLDMAWKEVGVP